MLILSRRVDETVVIGDGIRVKILDIKGGQVRIGIDAPKEVPVHREEVFDRIKHEEQTVPRHGSSSGVPPGP